MQPLLLLSDETSIIHVQELHSWTNLPSFKEKVWIPSSKSLRDCISIGFIKDVLLPRCSSRPVNFNTVRLSHPIELHNISKQKITYFTEAWKLFSLAVILNFAVNWCEVWNRKIFGATHSIGPSDSFPTCSDPFADYSNYSWFQVRPTKWPLKKTSSTHRQSKSYL